MSTYTITSRYSNFEGFSLAANFRGTGSTVDVTQLNNLPTHVWIVSDLSQDTQTISPQIAPGLYIAPGSDSNLAISTQSYPWRITMMPNGVGAALIQDTSSGNYWVLTNPTSGQEIALISPEGAVEAQQWLLAPV